MEGSLYINQTFCEKQETYGFNQHPSYIKDLFRFEFYLIGPEKKNIKFKTIKKSHPKPNWKGPQIYVKIIQNSCPNK